MRNADDARWNHNLHYQRLILDAVPDGARSALDIGCGDGLLLRELATRVPHVVGIDVDAPSLARARVELSRASTVDAQFIEGDAMTHPFAPESFDVVAAVAMLHHLDARAGLERLRELVRLSIQGVAAGLRTTG